MFGRAGPKGSGAGSGLWLSVPGNEHRRRSFLGGIYMYICSFPCIVKITWFLLDAEAEDPLCQNINNFRHRALSV